MTPHWHDITIVGPGPSPWVTCSRPSCRVVYRSLAFVRASTPPCPMCGQAAIPAKHGPVWTQEQREAVSA